MRILHTTYQLRDVQDVEALCAHALRKAGITNLNPHEYEDAITTLITVCWQLSERYDPAKDRALQKGQQPSFANYAAAILRMRVTDWQRTTYGRTKWQFHDKTIEIPRNDSVSLDQHADAGNDHLAATLTTSEMDSPEHRSPDLMRTLTQGNRGESWEDTQMGRPTDGTTQSRDRAAA